MSLEISVGISTYNDMRLTIACVDSVIDHSAGLVKEIFVVDDGSNKRDHLDYLHKYLSKQGVLLLLHKENYGIPRAWQTLCENMNGDILCILNNDIVIVDDNTFRCAEYFLSRNTSIGAVGWNLIQVNPDTAQRGVDSSLYDIDENGVLHDKDPLIRPSHCGFPVGCSFAMTREAWEASGGWWTELRSFHEEIDMGFVLSSRGFYNYMLPYPSVEHWGSQTFRNNPELAVCEFDDNIADREEYISTLSNPRFWDESVDPDIPKLPHLKYIKDTTGFIWEQDGKDVTYRMEYSRYLFAKKWDVLDYYSDPMNPLFHRIIEPMPQQETLRWLNREMRQVIAERGEARYGN